MLIKLSVLSSYIRRELTINHLLIASLFISFYYFLPFETSLVAFPLNGFDDQERNLGLVKTDFQVLKLKFHSCNFKQAFYLLHKLHTA